MSNRIKTAYPGVYYRETRRLGGRGTEKVFYIVFKENGKTIEEKAGRQFRDDMTASKAVSYRAQRIEGKKLSRKDIKRGKEEAKKAEDLKWTIDKLWNHYKDTRKAGKGLKSD
jgi:hypothetical protein